MKKESFLKRYRMFIILLAFNVILGLICPDLGKSSFQLTKNNILEMLGVLPPIFILLGLLDVWVDRETMMKFLGKGSGIKGVLIAFMLGSFAAGPLYGAFPVATIMLRKGSSLFNVFIFIGAWSTMKIPMITFEATNLGVEFAFTRLLINIIGILVIAFIVEKSLSKQDSDDVYTLADKN